MRLFDKCWSLLSGEHRDWFRNAAADATCLVADAIAVHYHSSEQIEWASSDYPYARMPWNRTFVEFECPKETRTSEGVFDLSTKVSGSVQIGIMCQRAMNIAERNAVIAYQKIPREHRDKILGCDDFVIAKLCSAANGCPRLLPGAGFWMLRSDGFVEDTLFSLPDIGISRQQHSQAYLSWCTPAFLAFTFANCSNVKLQDVTEQEQPPEKIRRRLKLPETKRYTLNICGHSAVQRQNSPGSSQGIMPFHLCRGHFATYTTDRPMFGNPKLVGRFWHPPHTRGKKERGEIIKDYAITE